MKDKLVEYLREKYNPFAIVLHGSRASGNAREHSDWDFAIFTKERLDPPREIKFGANFEVKEVVLPITNVQNTFGFWFRNENVEILYDPENIVPELLRKNEGHLSRGNPFDEKDRQSRYSFLRWFIDTAEDYKEDNLIIFRKKFEFYDRAVSSWFRFKHKEFRPSDYEALPRIKRDDPEFYELLEAFVKGDANASIESAKKITKLLFPDLDSKLFQLRVTRATIDPFFP